MSDPVTDELAEVRIESAKRINRDPKDRESLAKAFGPVWDTTELRRDFEVRAFAAPFVVVRRRSDGATGAMFFQHAPRYYFDFVPNDIVAGPASSASPALPKEARDGGQPDRS